MDTRPSIPEMIRAARKFSDAELIQVLDALDDELQGRYKRANKRAARELHDAGWVETTRSGNGLPRGVKGMVVDVRRERADVHFPERGTFTLPASMLRKTEAPPGGCTELEPGV